MPDRHERDEGVAELVRVEEGRDEPAPGLVVAELRRFDTIR